MPDFHVSPLLLRSRRGLRFTPTSFKFPRFHCAPDGVYASLRQVSRLWFQISNFKFQLPIPKFQISNFKSQFSTISNHASPRYPDESGLRGRRITYHTKSIISGIIVFSFLFLIVGCTEKVEPPIHPDGWSDSSSTNFHGRKIASSGIESCKSCHGENYDGGSSGVACNRCHAGGESGHPSFFAWVNPDSVNYHGRIFWENGWDFGRCKSCHGDDFDKAESSGGVVGYACSNCHTQGIGSCTTCHGDRVSDHAYPPKDIKNRSDPTLVSVGAHKPHLESDIAIISCNQCHIVPEDYLDEEHLGSDNVAEIVFGALATDSSNVEPVWNRESTTCSKTYCHGNFTYGDISGNDAIPIWTSPGSVVCGFCHGIPPTGHSGNYTLQQCSWCHSSVVNSDGEIIDKSKHVNGEEDF